MFSGCFAFGPVLVTAGEITDPHTLDLACTIHRDGRVLWRGSVNTREIRRRCPELVEWLMRDNPIPTGTVLSTGTGILVAAWRAAAISRRTVAGGALRAHHRRLRRNARTPA